MEFYQSPDGRPLPRPKITIYNPQQGCPVAQQKGHFGGAGAHVNAAGILRQATVRHDTAQRGVSQAGVVWGHSAQRSTTQGSITQCSSSS